MHVPTDDPFLALFTMDACSEEIYWTDREGRFIYVNDAACRALGYSREEMLAKSVWDIAHDFPKGKWAAHRDALRAAGSMRFEAAQKPRDGRIRLVEISAAWLAREGHEFTCAFSRDISLRKQNEAEALERERWLSDSQKAGGTGCYRFDLVSDHWKCTATMEEIFGIGPDYPKSFAGWIRLVAPGEREAMAAYCASVAASDAGFDREYRIVRASDGAERWVHGRGEFTRDASGKPLSMIGTIMDVTDRKRTEEALRESEARFALFMEHLPVAAFIKDSEGRVLMANRYLQQLTGVAEEMRGRTTAELFPPGIAARMIEDDRRALADGLTVVEESVPDPSGGLRNFQTIKFPVPVEGGKVVLGGIAIEMTERKRAEEALRTKERILRALIDANPESLFLLGLDATVIEANRTFAERIGKPLEEILGRNLRDLQPKGVVDSRKDWVTRLVASGKPAMFEDRIDGRDRDNRFFPAFGPSGEIDMVAGLSIDVTERNRLQEQLIRTQKLESLGVLAGGIAHDFNNILTAILGNLSLCRRMLDVGHPASGRLFECERATIRASELTQQLLTFAKGGAPVKGTVEPGSLIEEVMQFALRGSNVRGIVDLAPGLWCLDADEGQVAQLLNNLFINAKQAMPRGGTLTVRATNEIPAGRPGTDLRGGRFVAISVRDEGEGIPPENLGRIFDPYFTTKPGGSGLGLASVHSIVHRHGGTVEVSSPRGSGAEFLVRLPAAEAAAAIRPDIATDPLQGGTGRVLVMDDEEMVVRMATMMIEELGYEPEACADGAEAVERFRASVERKAPYAAVILDLTVPGGMGGRDAAARILEIDPDAVLVVSSGYSSDPVMADPPGYGFMGAVAKPYTLETLAAELARVTRVRKKS
ncbi:MAG TPA: PAS domain S-box protein [Candidatus Deferrimicrobiaceae bacterium]